ncbi:hypothetical protein GSI_10108 [Ganoderma sinense ZZ0214-1]|uniref:Uncharacterized protein n=1 Tax=Ganoderma sinense ZZ0214-1 TaxID=1077348 RepID=A0A2G8RZM0_9APHY|nr:hypothetical protein GSI_10108 [Ganoderma sinense ZZ0214-1]
MYIRPEQRVDLNSQVRSTTGKKHLKAFHVGKLKSHSKKTPAGHLVPPQGIFIGSAPALFGLQRAVDVYFEDYFAPAPLGNRFRIDMGVLAWGISVALVETSPDYMLHPNQLQGPWTTIGAFRWLEVVDHGQQHTNPPVFAAPLPHNNPPLPPLIQFINLNFQIGFVINWHHKVTITRFPDESHPGDDLHYHKHEPRQGHGPEPPAIEPQGAPHWQFRRLELHTQVQNCRRAMR